MPLDLKKLQNATVVYAMYKETKGVGMRIECKSCTFYHTQCVNIDTDSVSDNFVLYFLSSLG